MFNKPRNNIESTEAMNCLDYTHTWQAPILRIKSGECHIDLKNFSFEIILNPQIRS